MSISSHLLRRNLFPLKQDFMQMGQMYAPIWIVHKDIIKTDENKTM